MPDERCPRCFSELGLTAPDWTDDPIKTPKGEAGDDYRGFIYFNPAHIQELQTLRTQQEIDAGITEENRTEFTEIDTENNLVNFYRTHLLELRESTEKILEALGQTKDTYFNYDEDGTEYNIGEHQTDWTDPNLETRANKFVNIKAYHIEDLRHFLEVVTWIETWENAEIKVYAEGDNIQGSETGRLWSVAKLFADINNHYAEIKNENDSNVLFLHSLSYGSFGAVDIRLEPIPLPVFKTTSRLSFDISNFNMSSEIPSGLYFSRTRFEIRVLNYSFPGLAFDINFIVSNDTPTVSYGDRIVVRTINIEEFQNFNRNLYDDIKNCNLWNDSFLEGAGISRIFIVASTSSEPSKTRFVEYNIDNIRLT